MVPMPSDGTRLRQRAVLQRATAVQAQHPGEAPLDNLVPVNAPYVDMFAAYPEAELFDQRIPVAVGAGG